MSYMTTSERQSLLSADLAAARTRLLFVQALHRIAAAFGLAETTLLHAPTPEDLLLKPLIIESSLPASYIRAFDRAHMLRHCPFSSKLRESAVPQHWNLAESMGGQSLDSELRELMIQHGMPTGIAFPINAIDGHRLVFWFGGTRAAFAQNEVNELTMIVLHALDAYNAVKRNEECAYNALSARELSSSVADASSGESTSLPLM